MKHQATRPIALRSRGQSHGPLTRLVSPSQEGELIKPFVFLDSFNTPPGQGPNFGFHPHSGIATITLLVAGSIWYEEQNGLSGTLEAGDVEWLRAGHGVWHRGGLRGEVPVKGLQLWLALPPELENAPAESQYVAQRHLPSVGPARLILGSYGGAQSLIAAPQDVNYLDVRLKAGQQWTYETPGEHDVAWIAVHSGKVMSGEAIEAGELVVFAASDQRIRFEALEDAGFVLGSAVRHGHALVLGSHSVHTSAAALAKGQAEIHRLRPSPTRQAA
jgi:redox-sensitive bicupin YhaK (pirin superfamily)